MIFPRNSTPGFTDTVRFETSEVPTLTRVLDVYCCPFGSLAVAVRLYSPGATPLISNDPSALIGFDPSRRLSKPPRPVLEFPTRFRLNWTGAFAICRRGAATSTPLPPRARNWALLFWLRGNGAVSY